jgi:eukaryotic-like serine/threonine-protein kinase
LFWQFWLVVLAFLVMQWLNFSTNQDQRIEVPDLSRLTLNVVEDSLDELDLRYEILDSANFNPDYPRYAVIDQVPAPGSYVKENRKIYLTLNPSGYSKSCGA